MKILVLSDSHSARNFMRLAIRAVRPDQVIHLGDHYEDGEVMQEENPGILFHLLPGNCDRFRCDPTLPQLLCYDVGGVRMLMTHGHNHYVKSGLHRLLAQARVMDASAAVFGHTHEAVCYQEEDGLWVLNPGACGGYGGSVGLIETDGKTIISCRILRQEDLEEML